MMSVSLGSSETAKTGAMKRLLIIALMLAPLALPLAPASAQRSERLLTIFGEDKCPADTICVRAPERDRYRIPKELRRSTVTPDSQSWAVRSQSTLDTGHSGINSCSTSGPQGWTGCWLQQMKQAREEAKQNAAADRETP